MRGFERTAEKSALYASALQGPYPVQVVWGEHDPALKMSDQGEKARRLAGLDQIHTRAGQALHPGGPGAGDRRARGRAGRRPEGVELRGLEPLTFGCQPTLFQLSYSPSETRLQRLSIQA